MVMLFNAPGSRVNGPADCTNLLSPGVLPVLPGPVGFCSAQSVNGGGLTPEPAETVPQFNGSLSPGKQ